ncbi:MAG: radical SAM protein [Planctomycetota bacterium]
MDWDANFGGRLNAERLDPTWQWTTGGEATCRRLRLGGHVVDFFPEDLALFRPCESSVPGEKVHAVVPLPPPGGPRGVGALVIVPTHECNLACSYCYQREAGRTRGRRELRAPTDLMTETTVCRALDLLEVPNPRISFFGGEPLLAWGRIAWAVERAKARFVKPHFHVTTNGLLLSERRVDVLAEHGFSMIVSIDGPKELHDTRRRDARGLATYSRVTKALELIAAKPELAARTTLRGTFVPGEAEIRTRLAHLNDLADELGLGNVSVEAATGCAEGCSGGMRGFNRGEFARILLDGAAWAVERARAGKRARWHWLSTTLHRLMRRKPYFAECGAGVGYLTVAPEGDIDACHKEGCLLGNLRTGLDERAREPWRVRLVTERERCSRCWARLLCGGGCRVEGLHACGQVGPGATSCALGKARSLAALTVAAELAGEEEALARILPGANPRKERARDAVQTVAT